MDRSFSLAVKHLFHPMIHAEDAKSNTVREIIKASIGSYVEVIVTD